MPSVLIVFLWCTMCLCSMLMSLQSSLMVRNVMVMMDWGHTEKYDGVMGGIGKGKLGWVKWSTQVKCTCWWHLLPQCSRKTMASVEAYYLKMINIPTRWKSTSYKSLWYAMLYPTIQSHSSPSSSFVTFFSSSPCLSPSPSHFSFP